MNFKNYLLLVKSLFSRTPPYVIFFVTALCNARCKFCFNWKAIENPDLKNELTLEEIKKISKNFGDILFLTISGGEPTLRRDLPEIIRTFVVNNNVKFVSIPTNAISSGNIKEKIETILKQNPETFFNVRMSLDGIGKDHEEIRQVKGIFEKYKKTYEKLNLLKKKYKNFDLDAVTVYSYYNKGKAKEIFEYVKKHFYFDNHILALVRGTVKNPTSRDVSLKEFEELVELVEKDTQSKKTEKGGLLNRLLKAIKLLMRDIQLESLKKRKMILPCLSGKKMVVIRENGDVYPCELLPNKKFGNLRSYNYDIKKILAGKRAKEVVKFIKDTKCYCTFECAIQNNIVYSPFIYPKVFKKLVKTK